jgi:hypothetical protein
VSLQQIHGSKEFEMTVYANATARNYRQLAQATNHLSADEQEAVVRACNAVRPFIRQGFLRIEGNRVVVVSKKTARLLDAVEKLVLYMGAEKAVAILAAQTGIAQVANKIQDFGPNPF